MNWQEWIVVILVILCFGEIFRRIYLFFRLSQKNENPCEKCASGCELKDLLDEKKKKCSEKPVKPKKNSCG